MNTLRIFVLLVTVNILAVNTLPAQSGKANWPFSFSIPSGWVAQEDDENIVLQHPRIKGAIIINAHYESELQPVMERLQNGDSGEDFTLMIKGQVQKLNRNLLTAKYTGWLQGVPVRAQTYSTISKSGGAYVTALAGKDIFSLNNCKKQPNPLL